MANPNGIENNVINVHDLHTLVLKARRKEMRRSDLYAQTEIWNV